MAELIEILLAGGFLGTVSALIGVGVSQYFGYLNRRSEEKRWYAQYFLDLKIEALKKLQVTLEECNKKCHIYGNIGVSNFGEYQKEIVSSEDAYRTALRMAIIYLKDNEKKIFENALGEFRKVFTAISNAVPLPKSYQKASIGKSSQTPTVNNWQTLLNAYNDSVDCIKDLLNPKNLREYIEKI